MYSFKPVLYHILIGTYLLITGAVLAEQRQLTGEEIEALLPTIIATGRDTRQTFSQNGRTTYHNGGRASFGRWWVEENLYCSNWPPADGKACYQVWRDKEKIIWIGESGTPTENRVETKQRT